ncbi:MAG: M28 family peptidase [Bacteroidetes bacterium]|nr:M28 family peptidase [Bacteroidota bacterium]
MKNSFFMLCFAFGVFAEVGAQDSLYTRSIIKTLCSDNFHGRGYVNNGDRRAANFIKDEFVKNGISTVSLNNYFQDFSFSVNTFSAKMEVKIDGNSIEPGRDFIVQPESPTCKGKFDVLYIDKKLSEYSIEVIKEKWILLDTTRGENPFSKEEYQTWLSLDEHIKGIIQVIPKKLTWSVGTTQNKIPTIQILKSDYTNKIQKLEVNIQSKFIRKYQTSNVIGFIEGKSKKDSFLVMTAHYDHLGRMGKNTIFPGANDNASGIAMLIQMGKYFAQKENQLEYSILFIAFAGEEAGLIGSKYYVENPWNDLTKIKFLLNMDLLGTGDDGMMVVNATEFPNAFQSLDSLNIQHNYLPKIGKRGKAANSDHYWFTEKGVPSFFCYTLGGITAYHDVYDIEKLYR